MAAGETIPVLVDHGAVIVGERAIIEHLSTHNAEPSEAGRHRDKVSAAHRKRLEAACR
ncbi:MAG: hypothetical protein M0T77_08760 [Actinomycetota bacterium]|nr:hypothetical protein [Actinomycetota bacterium]